MTAVRLGLAAVLAATALAALPAPASAQSVGWVTGIPGPDPAYDDEIGWGPAYRPDTSYAQPGTPPTPGQLAARAYEHRYGRPVYPPYGATGALAPDEAYRPPRRYRHHRHSLKRAWHGRKAPSPSSRFGRKHHRPSS